jgi:hypothetical protein
MNTKHLPVSFIIFLILLSDGVNYSDGVVLKADGHVTKVGGRMVTDED